MFRTIAHGHIDTARALRYALCGLAAGGLFWIRYAAVFVPLAIGVYLLIEYARRRRAHLFDIVVFGVCAALPVATLLFINKTFATTPSVQTQLNLGHTVELNLSLEMLTTAWWNFTRFGFYDYHWYSHWLFALWPMVVIAVSVTIPSARKVALRFIATPAVALSASVVVTLLVMLAGATALFGGKFDYMGLDRYYTPVKPLYFLLFVAPVMHVPRRVLRVVLCVGLLIACSWLVQYEWPRPYKRWLAANRETTPYGQWGYCFRPHAADLYQWLDKQKADNLVVVSNFPDYITLETKIPALPVPVDRAALNTWLARIRAARGITEPRVLFVLDPDNRWRNYYLEPPDEVIRDFALTHRVDAPVRSSAGIFEYDHASSLTVAADSP